MSFVVNIRSRWLGMRLDANAALVLCSVLMSSILLQEFSTVNTSSLGLVLSQILQILTYVQWFTRQSAEVENQMVSTERILEYTKLEAEAEEELDDYKPPDNWPDSGKVEVKDLSVVYPGTSKLVIKNISFEIPAGAKVSILYNTRTGRSGWKNR
jgi:ABC-type multidrug transport system fused ATPase/permease subunit